MKASITPVIATQYHKERKTMNKKGTIQMNFSPAKTKNRRYTHHNKKVGGIITTH